MINCLWKACDERKWKMPVLNYCAPIYEMRGVQYSVTIFATSKVNKGTKRSNL